MTTIRWNVYLHAQRGLRQRQHTARMNNLRRLLSSSHVPEPTWSLKDLELTSKQPLIPQEELQRLSRRALINIDSSDCEVLQQDLANMLHMVDQVSSYKFKEGDVVVDNDAIYDEVRGVTAAPLRKTAEEDSMQQADQEQAEMVWKNLLQSKTTRKGGGHEYFAIQTKQG